MKRKTLAVLVTSLITILLFSHALAADVEWQIDKLLKLEKPPLDMAVALNGRWIYVLADLGQLEIYNPRGSLEDTITVGKHVDGIRIGPWEDKIFLTSKVNKSIELLSLLFVQNISIQGSPFKGKPNAEVVIITFDDYQ